MGVCRRWVTVILQRVYIYWPTEQSHFINHHSSGLGTKRGGRELWPQAIVVSTTRNSNTFPTHFPRSYILFLYFAFCFVLNYIKKAHIFYSVFKHVNIYTYTRHTHKYGADMYKLYNGVNNNNKKDKTKIVRTSIYKQIYRHTLTTTWKKEEGTATSVTTTCKKGRRNGTVGTVAGGDRGEGGAKKECVCVCGGGGGVTYQS